MSDGRSHAAHLAIFSLHQLQRDPGVGYGRAHADGRHARCDLRRRIEPACRARPRTLASNRDAAREAGERRLVGRTLDLRPIFTAMPRIRMEEARIQSGLIGQQQQSLRIRIEPPQRIHIRRQMKVRQRPPPRSRFRRELGKHTVGFMQREKHRERS